MNRFSVQVEIDPNQTKPSLGFVSPLEMADHANMSANWTVVLTDFLCMHALTIISKENAHFIRSIMPPNQL